MTFDRLFFEALGSMLAGGGAIVSAGITFVFYRELTGIERARSERETSEFKRQKKEKLDSRKAAVFERTVSDFVQEIKGRTSEHYQAHDVLIDLAQESVERRVLALEALDRYLTRKEKIPSERESVRAMILARLDIAEPESWPGWESR